MADRPSPYVDVSFGGAGERELARWASLSSWRGWACRAAEAWGAPRLLDGHGRFAKMSRRDFHELGAARLRELVAWGLRVDCPPWGVFCDEEPTGDRELDGERLQSWYDFAYSD